MSKLFTYLVLLSSLTLLGICVWKGFQVPPLPDEPVRQTLQLEVADTPEKRAKGLEGVKSIPPGTGMLFVFDQPAIQCMWNKKIPFAVEVGFFDEEFRFINSEVMPAHSEKKVCSVGPAKYAIERGG